MSPKTELCLIQDWSSPLDERLGCCVSKGQAVTFAARRDTYQEILPKGFDVGVTQSAQILVNRAAVHAHFPQLHIPQPGQVLLAGLGVDRFLQGGRLPHGIPPLGVFRVEVGVGRECPAQRGEMRHHESIEAGQCGLGGLVGRGTVCSG